MFEKSEILKSIRFPLFIIFILWLIKAVEIYFHLNFVIFGIKPLEIVGLRGIFLAPLIHSDFSHLFSNSIPLLILLSSIFYFYKDAAWKIFVISYVLVGILVWLLGRPSYHIGISGEVYVYFGFLTFNGLFYRQRKQLALSLLTIFIYGSMIWGIAPSDKHISWESHLFGLILGLVLAIIYGKKFKNSTPNENIPEQNYSTDFWNDVIEE